MRTFSHSNISFTSKLKAQQAIFNALILRDVQTRFGSTPAFLLAIAWPLSHILILVGMNVLLGRQVPYGESAALWFATGLVPFMIFSYTSRLVMMGIVLNRPLLAFSRIKMLDILFSRAIVEMLVSAMVILALIIAFLIFDIDFVPINKVDALYALFSCLWMGIGVGVVNAIIAMVFVQWMTVFSLILLFLWITCGAFFVPSNLPLALRELLYFHPSVHSSEWLRSAYYDGYNSILLDKQFHLLNATFWVFVGLCIERLVRGRMLAG